MRIGLVGTGAMGSALGAGWRAAGHEVRTDLTGRSPRTRELAAAAGLTVVGSLDAVVDSDVVVSVVPPGAAVAVARDVAAADRRVGARPLVVDLNAISPATVAAVAGALGGLALVDGSISGPPPRAGRPVRVYLSGPDAGRVPGTAWLDAVVLPGPVGAASALKMCTASMYKGTSALVLQAMATAEHHGVLEEFLTDVAREWPEQVPHWPQQVALAASKADRFADEMREIARTQAAAGQSPALFEGAAATWSRVAGTALARHSPEDAGAARPAGDVLAELRDPPRRGVLFDFSSTLFRIERAEHALLAALGPDFVDRAGEMVRRGAINGSPMPDGLPDHLVDAWLRRDLSADAHRAAYGGSARLAGLSDEQADRLYARGIAPEAWAPYPDTVDTLRALHAAGVAVAVVSNIGWDPRPVLRRYGVLGDIDALVLSDERALLKPDPAIFTSACAELGLDPAQCVMVGDDEANDGGSRAVGVEFRLVDADPAERDPDALWRAAGLPPRGR